MSEFGLGTDALPGACGPSQSGRLQAGLSPLLLHSTWPRPPDRAIGPAGHSSYTVPGRGFGPARDRTHRSTGTCGPSQSGRLQVGRPPLLLHRHDIGPRPQDRAIRTACHSSYTVRCHGPWRDRTQSPKHWRVRTAPVRTTSSWAAPAAQAVTPYQTATGQGHRNAGHSSYTVPGRGFGPRVPRGIGLTEALARAGRPSQEDFKLGGPRCSGCCTVPDLHRTGPSAGGPLYSPRSRSRAAS